MPFALTRTCKNFTITHVVIDSTKPFANVQAFLEATIPPIEVQRTQASSGLVIFLKRDYVEPIGRFDLPREAVQYEIGSSRTLPCLIRLPATALYQPVRVLLYENQGGGSRFEYDLPSSQVRQFGDDRITQIGRRMDLEIGRALSDAAE